jgi:DNA-binding response OmpR family regulator
MPGSPASDARLLIVDDDVELGDLVGRLFRREGMAIDHVTTLASARRFLAAHRPACALIDVMLPDGSGLDLCRDWRAEHPALPMLLLTARGDPMDRVIGLEIGADDYLAKPFEGRELVARVRALLRRAALPSAPGTTPADHVQIGAMRVDYARMAVRVGAAEVILPPGEFRLLSALIRNAGRPMTREALTAEVQAARYRPLERAIDVQVGRLRRRLRDRIGVDPIHTVRGSGYVLLPGEATP